MLHVLSTDIFLQSDDSAEDHKDCHQTSPWRSFKALVAKKLVIDKQLAYTGGITSNML